MEAYKDYLRNEFGEICKEVTVILREDAWPLTDLQIMLAHAERMTKMMRARIEEKSGLS